MASVVAFAGLTTGVAHAEGGPVSEARVVESSELAPNVLSQPTGTRCFRVSIEAHGRAVSMEDDAGNDCPSGMLPRGRYRFSVGHVRDELLLEEPTRIEDRPASRSLRDAGLVLAAIGAVFIGGTAYLGLKACGDATKPCTEPQVAAIASVAGGGFTGVAVGLAMVAVSAPQIVLRPLPLQPRLDLGATSAGAGVGLAWRF